MDRSRPNSEYAAIWHQTTEMTEESTATEIPRNADRLKESTESYNNDEEMAKEFRLTGVPEVAISEYLDVGLMSPPVNEEKLVRFNNWNTKWQPIIAKLQADRQAKNQKQMEDSSNRFPVRRAKFSNKFSNSPEMKLE
ncbi:hypothetical protein PENTCL1PPCAC_28116 [Pristionchus entomophagus]|uniref:Uncharacterized protein n=1 Tax=Pristionchus entomophagus TaxID=358040 RepID=A0AAV5UH77_9BILA|nr:hypothetical protein PENTCL1PPCAC_28116 [Pristionchus entomophagus]